MIALATRKIASVLTRLARVATYTDVNSVTMQAEKSLFLLGQIAAHQVRACERLDVLADAAFKVSSQWGEDGIIEWLVHAVDVNSTTFVEFGVEDFSEANCRFLMEHRNWKGLVFDGDYSNIKKLHQYPHAWKYDLRAECHFITVENINGLIQDAGFEGDLGILSVDIDGADYWVYDAIECVRPAILILEYNSVFGDLLPVTVPYRADFIRQKAHSSGLYYGASLKAMQDLALKKGYTFVGTPRTGANAFFVRSDLAERVLAKIDRVVAFPSLFREARNDAGELIYARGLDRFDQILGMMVVNTSTGLDVKLERVDEFYSKNWVQDVE